MFVTKLQAFLTKTRLNDKRLTTATKMLETNCADSIYFSLHVVTIDPVESGKRDKQLQIDPVESGKRDKQVTNTARIIVTNYNS